MRKLLFLLLIFVALSGCVDQGLNYSNNVITLEDYHISTLSPYAGSTTTIDFLVQNNADEPVENVEVNFFAVPGFSIVGLECQEPNQRPDSHTCVFSKIDSLDIRSVAIILQPPYPESITSPTPFTVNFYVKYDHSGYREANIPIIDGVTRRTPLAKFSQSSPNYGPITLEFEAPVGRETKVDSQITKEYWGIISRPFEVKMNFRHVGSSIGNIQTLTIPAGGVMLDLKGSLIISSVGGRELPCDFIAQGDKLVSKKPVLVLGGKSGEDQLICNFQSRGGVTDPELLASIAASFRYRYEFIKTETFTVKPLPVD